MSDTELVLAFGAIVMAHAVATTNEPFGAILASRACMLLTGALVFLVVT